MPSAIDMDNKHNHYHHHHHNHQQLIQHGPPRPPHSPPLSLVPSSRAATSASALLSLSQDITALVSLSLEATASLVNDYVRATLGTIGVGEFVRADPVRRGTDSGAGLAVVVVGAADPTGQSLTLRLAKSGYTVFPFVPVASPLPGSAHTAAPLSSLLLSWSTVQKRLQARDPGHTGAVVPVVIDDSGDVHLSTAAYNHPPSPSKRNGRFTHAGETVRAYCRENGLALVAIVCAAPAAIRPTPLSPDTPPALHSPPLYHETLPTLPPSALARAHEDALMAMYRSHVVDPLSVVRALGDLLACPRGVGGTRGRVLFVETSGSVNDVEPGDVFGAFAGASRMIAAARAETAKLLRSELGSTGIDVCEIVVGHMSPRMVGPMHLRSSSGDSDTDKALAANTYPGNNKAVVVRDDALTSRIRLLARIFAVDDALVYSCVRRAIEDRYPRTRHHAGLAPLVSSIVNATPGTGIVRFLGRWVLGRLFAPRSSATA